MALSACGLAVPARLAYQWLRDTQRPDGSWPRTTGGPGAASPDEVTDHAAESHHAAYVAVGVWHEYLVTGDRRFALRMWPAVRRGDRAGCSTCRRRAARWRGSATRPACPARSRCSPGARASCRGCAARSRSPSWPASRSRTGSSRPTSSATCSPAIPRRSRTRAGSRWTGTTRCSAARCAAAPPPSGSRRGWDTFVVPGLGVRCVSDQPWVTVAETCELAHLPRRLRPAGAGARGVRHDAAGCGTRTAPTGPAGSTSTRTTSPPSGQAGPPPPSCSPPTRLTASARGAAIFRAIPAPASYRLPADPAACGCEATAAARTGQASPRRG